MFATSADGARYELGIMAWFVSSWLYVVDVRVHDMTFAVLYHADNLKIPYPHAIDDLYIAFDQTLRKTMTKYERIPVTRFTQWRDAWDEFEFDAAAQRRKPNPHIYLFSMSATSLRYLSDVYRREHSVESAEGIQRAREENRTARIRRYVEAGYPFGDLRENLHEKNLHLRKPGWLPTAIVVNILTPSDERRGKKIKKEHQVRIFERDGVRHLRFPVDVQYRRTDVRPLEVIDGQHRLWAFNDDDEELSEFELPVVAFKGLDVAWQAYLFWSINISPKRINPSHAFDLYPLLRTQDWLESTGEITVYREARAQEITEILYTLKNSPWHNRISMLQRRGDPKVSQFAFVRSLIGSFFGTGRGRGRFGIFQAPYDDKGSTLDWERVQQIAFILEFWLLLKSHVEGGDYEWTKLYHARKKDPFADKSSLLNQDMGIRAVHAVLNDLLYHHVREWRLNLWYHRSADKSSMTAKDIKNAVIDIRNKKIHVYLDGIASAMAGFDWRSVDGPDVKSSEDEMTKRAYRGSGGYTVLTKNILTHIVNTGSEAISDAADFVLTTLD